MNKNKKLQGNWWLMKQVLWGFVVKYTFARKHTRISRAHIITSNFFYSNKAKQLWMLCFASVVDVHSLLCMPIDCVLSTHTHIHTHTEHTHVIFYGGKFRNQHHYNSMPMASIVSSLIVQRAHTFLPYKNESYHTFSERCFCECLLSIRFFLCLYPIRPLPIESNQGAI